MSQLPVGTGAHWNTAEPDLPRDTVRVVARRLGTLPDSPVSVILACTAREAHTLALEALRAALDERGHGAVLGADVAAAALIDAIGRRPHSQTVVLWSQRRDTADVDTAKAVIRARTGLAVAGQGWVAVNLPRRAKRLANLYTALEHLGSRA